jgi:type II secretory pathway component PulM
MQEYMLLGMILLLILLLMWSLIRKPQNQEVITQLTQINQDLRNQNASLLNRLQAPDLRTFQVLQASSMPIQESEYIPRDDESEVARLHQMSSGMPDDDFSAYPLADFGFGLNPDRVDG